MSTELEEYNKSLDHALTKYMEGDERPINRHIRRFDLWAKFPNDPHIRKCALMKAVTGRTGIRKELRALAKQWLLEHGYQSWDDGDI